MYRLWFIVNLLWIYCGLLQLIQHKETTPVQSMRHHFCQECINRLHLLGCWVQLCTCTLAKTLNDAGSVHVAFLDFAKAFNTVPHQHLLHKLGNYGIQVSC